jgi:hypothetical protein
MLRLSIANAERMNRTQLFFDKRKRRSGICIVTHTAHVHTNYLYYVMYNQRFLSNLH